MRALIKESVIEQYGLSLEEIADLDILISLTNDPSVEADIQFDRVLDQTSEEVAGAYFQIIKGYIEGN